MSPPAAEETRMTDTESRYGISRLELMDPHTTSVDNIPVFWGPAPGPLRAALAFRVGFADEPLSRRGITHVVEHLALSKVGWRPYDYNGMVTPSQTVFYASGEPDEIVEFCAAVCDALGAMPYDRLPVELRVLRTEAQSREPSAFGSMSVYRFGAQGFGMTGYDELGLDVVAANDVENWVARCFTAGNATMWFSGEPPAALRLPLRQGPRLPSPSTSSPVQMSLPGWFCQRSGGVGASFLVDRSTAAVAYSAMLSEQLERRLRHERGVSYGVNGGYERLDGRRSLVHVFADALDESLPEVRDVVAATVEDFAAGRCGDGEQLERYRRQALKRFEDPGMQHGMAASWAADSLVGAELLRTAQYHDQLLSLTATDIWAVARQAADSALYLLPVGLDMPSWRYHAVPLWSRTAVTGMRLAAVDGSRNELIVADYGLSIVGADGKMVTAMFANVSCVLAWSDGSRTLIEHEGFALSFDPAHWHFPWRNPSYVTELVDRSVPGDRFVFKGDAAPAASAPATPEPAQPLLSTPVLVAALLLGLFLTLAGLVMLINPAPDASRGDGAMMFIVAGVPTGFGVATIARRVRARR